MTKMSSNTAKFVDKRRRLGDSGRKRLTNIAWDRATPAEVRAGAAPWT